MKQTLENPRFLKLSQGECAGAPIFRSLWEKFDFSLLLTQSGGDVINLDDTHSAHPYAKKLPYLHPETVCLP